MAAISPTFLSLDANNTPHVKYPHNPKTNGNCISIDKYKSYNGTSWQDEAYFEHRTDNAMDYDSQQRGHKCEIDKTGGLPYEVKYSYQDAAGLWQSETVFNLHKDGNTECSIAIGPDDEPHLAFAGPDGTNSVLYYARHAKYNRHSLLINKPGLGIGTVTSSQEGINCGADCFEEYSPGTSVTLTATPSTDSTFTGWSGGGCSGTSTCTVTIDAAKYVTATFTIPIVDGFNTYVHGIISNYWEGSSVNSIALQTDGKILIGGAFTTIGEITRNGIARLNSDSSLDAAFNPNANDFVSSIAVQADGKILIGGYFTTIGGVTRNRIARLNSDGSLDAAFNPNANDFVSSIAVQADGKILIGGAFTTIGGVTRNRIARLNSDGSLDVAFNPNASSSVNSIALQTDGKILIGGAFTTIGGVTRNRIARLNSDGSLDAAFNPNANGNVNSIALQADGKILICGYFTTIGGITHNYIARLNLDGSLDAAFNPNALGEVYKISVQADGKILIGGWFNAMGGTIRFNIARLNVTADTNILAVSKEGTGSGTVTSSPAGINCGGDCTETVNYNTSVTLTTAPATGSTFTGWSGGGCSGTGTCTVTIDAAKQVTATFTLDATYTLTVTKSGTGIGTVTSSPSGIDCGGDCTETLNYMTFVTFTATPSAGSAFTGWSGSGCSGTGTCIVAMTTDKSVTAAFMPNHTLTVTSACGTVTSSPSGINCGADCSEAYDEGTAVTLNAAPNAGYLISGWSGDADRADGIVTMNADKSCSATCVELPSV
ncbi:MAG: delta-60 repeat domain-containing protein, partial [Nitrospirae bacterium]|nr:delta-60 repeat domain-containing protein [Nitrospirota bacterium]